MVQAPHESEPLGEDQALLRDSAWSELGKMAKTWTTCSFDDSSSSTSTSTWWTCGIEKDGHFWGDHSHTCGLQPWKSLEKQNLLRNLEDSPEIHAVQGGPVALRRWLRWRNRAKEIGAVAPDPSLQLKGLLKIPAQPLKQGVAVSCQLGTKWTSSWYDSQWHQCGTICLPSLCGRTAPDSKKRPGAQATNAHVSPPPSSPSACNGYLCLCEFTNDLSQYVKKAAEVFEGQGLITLQKRLTGDRRKVVTFKLLAKLCALRIERATKSWCWTPGCSIHSVRHQCGRRMARRAYLQVGSEAMESVLWLEGFFVTFELFEFWRTCDAKIHSAHHDSEWQRADIRYPNW